MQKAKPYLYERRINSMFNDFRNKMKYLVLVTVVAFSMLAFTGTERAFSGDGGGPPGFEPFFSVGNWGLDVTDSGAFGLVFYYDTQNRQTIIQLTNISADFIPVHVQAWEIGNPLGECFEEDFDVCLTPGQTVIYDVASLPEDISLVDSYGFITAYYDFSAAGFFNCFEELGVPFEAENGITAEQAEAAAQKRQGELVQTRAVGDAVFPLIGMFRVIDDEGFEYRTNAVAPVFGLPINLQEIETFTDFGNSFTLNYNNFNGHAFSDVIGITYEQIGIADTLAGPGYGTIFGQVVSPLPALFFPDIVGNLNFDSDEDPSSCPDTVFACAEGKLNKGIDRSIPNSKGLVNEICGGSRLSPTGNDSGFLWLPFKGFVCPFPFGDSDTGECFLDGRRLESYPVHNFVGFLGLNDGTDTGSMDSWWYNAELTTPFFFVKDGDSVEP